MCAFISNIKAPETCRSNISMNFPVFPCLFLDNLFSSYLDPHHLSSLQTKVLMQINANCYCSDQLMLAPITSQGANMQRRPNAQEIQLPYSQGICYIQEPEHNRWLTQPQKMSSGIHLISKVVTMQFSLLGCACCSFNILVSHIYTIYLVHSSNWAMKHTGPGPKFT